MPQHKSTSYESEFHEGSGFDQAQSPFPFPAHGVTKGDSSGSQGVEYAVQQGPEYEDLGRTLEEEGPEKVWPGPMREFSVRTLPQGPTSQGHYAIKSIWQDSAGGNYGRFQGGKAN